MPLSWTLTTYLSAAAFLITARFAWKYTTWLSLYLFICFPIGVTWAIQHGHVPYWTRPITLGFQIMAVIEAIALMHRDCWNPRRRYLCAAFCGLGALAGTFWVVEYPGFPHVLYWACLWVELSAAGACFATLSLYRWWNGFQPPGWTIGNVVVMEAYCAVEVIALLWPVTPANWVGVDLTLQLIQDCCLLWWVILYSRDT